MKSYWNYNEKSINLPLSAQIIKNRNCKETCFYNKLSDFADINLLKNLDAASKKIIEFLKNNKKIIIFGHDDPDGITATYILYDFFASQGYKNIHYYIPNRKIERHGIQDTFLNKVFDLEIDLVITVDNGIASYDAVKTLKEHNVTVIITDHHLIPDKLPPADIIVNPKLADSLFPDRFIAGVGVAYFLMLKMAELTGANHSLNYLFWTALGTFADRVQLQDANRIIIREAFANWQFFDDEPLYFIDKNFQTYTQKSQMQNFLEFLIPIIHNGRDKNGEHQALKMLISTNHKEKKEIYQKLFSQKISYENRRQAMDRFINNLPKPNGQSYIFIDKNDDVPYDFTGYLAGELASKYQIPSLVIKKHNDIWNCEARATSGFNLIDAFKFAKEHLIQFGGHAQAAGFTIREEMIDAFTNEFNKYIQLHLNEKKENKTIIVDAVIDCDKTKADSFLSENLEDFYPFGQNFGYPVILLKNFHPQNTDLNDFILSGFGNITQKSHLVISLQKNILKLIDYEPIR